VTDAPSDFYDDFAEYQLRYLGRPNRRFRFIRERLRPFLARKPQSALDIGCGIGIMTDWLARSVEHVVGVDVSPRNIRIAKAMYEKPHFAVCDLPESSLPPGPFALITLLDVLEHFPVDHRRAVFSRIADVLQDDTLLVVNIPSKLFALRVPEERRQVIDEAVGADEVVALAATLHMEPLVVDRYGVSSTNQYVFCAFSRTYDVEGRARPSLHATAVDELAFRWNGLRRWKQLERLRKL
jgi:SAM-dependent methyltransferase